MKYTFSFFVFLFCLSANISAQNEVMVYLKNGSQIKGAIEVDSSEEKTELTLSDGTLILLDNNQIEHIDLRPDLFEVFDNGQRLLKKGTYKSFSIQYMTAKQAGEWQDDRRTGFSGSFSAGHQFAPALAVGGGVSVDLHEQVFVPVYAEIQGMLHRVFTGAQAGENGYRIPLTYSLQIGYNLPMEEWVADPSEFEKIRGGYLFFPSLGLSFPTREGNTLRFDFGYKFQRYTRKYEWDWSPDYKQEDVVTLKSFSLRGGLFF